MEFKTEMVPIFEKVVAARDPYGLLAHLTALETAGMRGQMEIELEANAGAIEDVNQRLQNVLATGTLPAEEPATATSLPNGAVEVR